MYRSNVVLVLSPKAQKAMWKELNNLGDCIDRQVIEKMYYKPDKFAIDPNTGNVCLWWNQLLWSREYYEAYFWMLLMMKLSSSDYYLFRTGDAKGDIERLGKLKHDFRVSDQNEPSSNSVVAA